MLSRRAFSTALASGLALPFAHPSWAQSGQDIRNAVQTMSQLHSIQVRRGDDLLVSEAPRGPGLDRQANIKSCSKSIVALLLGTSISRGEIANVDARLGDVAPGLIPGGADTGVADITMEDLVTLRAGLERTSGANYGGWVSSGNWVADALSRPMIAKPGARMLYSTGSTHVLGAALTEATGASLLALVRARLGDPMGFDVPPWTRDPQGYYLGGNEMALTPRAMLKLALLMRDQGAFDGRQIVARDWIDASITPRARSPYSGMSYGYGWFLTRSGYVLARGYGGQVIAAHSRRGLAIAITSDPTQPARSGGYFGDLVRLLDGPVLNLA
ncbi:serine hydrolase domain-containing protein [Qingshengfaniella alkalisoli]|uniref:Serine hydrolase n=1 Tax=Qingshengfaniella alkalisoli TaxID=2599296 RepID=A0A5B8IX56_9RHOB|nr:serine hydrolase [Qingshengfaniella alkalisoli]QDY70732.1 serine hydrolase [Qingshengfaniella alkalisoli]